LGDRARFADRVALVTGGTRGIGAAVSLALAQAGATVWAVYKSDRAAAAGLSAAAAGSIATIQADVSDPEAANAAVARVIAEQSRLDILVHCAGGSSDRLLLRATPDYVRDTIAGNLCSAIYTTKAALGPMLKQRYGRIVTIGSVVAATGNPGQSVYAAAKAGIEGFTRCVAREVGAKGITINCVSPGWIDTPLTAGVAEPVRERAVASTPVGRAGTPSDVARAVLFLASERASFVTGTVLQLNGGLYM
jgi:3-oxoacyl-[acyl-carrier protein] reductase